MRPRRRPPTFPESHTTFKKKEKLTVVCVPFGSYLRLKPLAQNVFGRFRNRKSFPYAAPSNNWCTGLLGAPESHLGPPLLPSTRLGVLGTEECSLRRSRGTSTVLQCAPPLPCPV